MDIVEEKLKGILNQELRKVSGKRLIYISHPYGGNEENKQHVETIVKQLIYDNPKNTYISPIHTFGYTYHDVEYDSGLQYCLNLLDVCDEMLVFGDWQSSKGCKAELKHAIDNNILFKIME